MTLDFKPGNPGSAQAIADGCTCPVIDNARGRGWMGGIRDERGETIFVVNVDCPLHGGKIPIEDLREQVLIEIENLIAAQAW